MYPEQGTGITQAHGKWLMKVNKKEGSESIGMGGNGALPEAQQFFPVAVTVNTRQLLQPQCPPGSVEGRKLLADTPPVSQE